MQKFYLIPIVLFIGLMVSFVGCGRDPDRIAELSQYSDSHRISRHLIGTMSFSVWDDFVVSEVGVEQDSRGLCRFVEPSRQDESTRWMPFQVYWVIYGDASEVRNGRKLSGFFGQEDVVDADKIVNLAGQKPLGFSYVNPAMYRVIDITPGEFGNDRTTLQTTLNVMGRRAMVRSKAFMQDERCEVSSEVCNGSVDCSAPGMFVKLGNFRVTQTLLGVPKDVSIDAEPQLRRL